MADLLADRRRDKVFPWFTPCDTGTDFGAGNVVEVAREPKGADRCDALGRYVIIAFPCGNQQVELTEHFLEGARSAIVPSGYSLGGVAAAKERQLDVATVGGAALLSYFHEEASVTNGNGVCRIRTDGGEHFQTLIHGCT